MNSKSDNPIKSPSDDTLSRTAIANSLAEEIRDIDASEGAVVAITGPWGSGKTSLVNLIREVLKRSPEVPVVEFNPWMFSGTEQLLESFFVELAAQLRIKDGSKLGEIAGEIEAYGELLSPLSLIPVFGGWFDRIRTSAGNVKKFQERKKQSVQERREKISARLQLLETRIVVVIDDLDRLDTAEIRDIFKLVRLTASFPQIVYLLAFDRCRIETALSDAGINGRSYLEKIIQVAVDIPPIPEKLIISQLASSLSEALANDGANLRFNSARWQDVLVEIVLPLVTNVRDIRRYAAGVRTAVRMLGNEIEGVDLLALEAIRIFTPDVYAEICAAQGALTSTRQGYGPQQDSEADQQAIQKFLAVANKHGDLGTATIRRLFPAASRHIGGSGYGSDWLNIWRKNRLVAHPDILRYYTERLPNAGVTSISVAESLLSNLHDLDQLAMALNGFSPDVLIDHISALEAFEDDFTADMVVPASVALMNTIPKIPPKGPGLLLPEPRHYVERVVLRLLRKTGGGASAEAALRDIAVQLHTFSARLTLINLASVRLSELDISQDFINDMRSDLKIAFSTTRPLDLANEWDIFRLLLTLQNDDPSGGTPFTSIEEPALNSQILLQAKTETRIQMVGNRAVHSQGRLIWDGLVKIYGDEDRIRRAVDSVSPLTRDNDELAEAVGLAQKYLSGWDPNED